MKKLIFLILFLISSPAFAEPKISILTWQEYSNLTTTGKISEILIQGKMNNLAPNQVMTSFSISFGSKQNIKITKVICDNKIANYSFQNNSLNITFPKEKSNNQIVAIYFSYEEKYEKISQFLRQESIDIPSFAAGATAKVKVNFPDYLESATLNPNITKGSNSFTYSNIVPAGGVRERIKLTPTQNVWDVSIKVKVDASNGLSNLTVILPPYFRNGGQKVENVLTKSSIEAVEESISDNNHILKFKTDQREITIENKAKIYTGRNNRTPISRNLNDYNKFSADEQLLLSPILEQIKRNPKYGNLPLYAKIGKFVNEFIKYDIRYMGKLPKINEILRNPVGVCTEYSNLYNSLIRVAGIPSVIIEGAACGEYDECQGHSWNMIYYNNDWIEVDPTWDLMSGVVSSSHVYFNDSDRGSISTEYFGNKNNISSKMDFSMKKSSL